MELINLRSLNLTTEESGDLIKFLAQKRGISTKKLLSTIKLNLKRKNNKDLNSKSQQKLIKKQQKLMKKQLELIKSQHELIKSIKSQQKITKQTKSQRELIKSQRKLKRLIKPQQTLSNTKEIRNHLYNNNNNNNNNNDFIENVRDLFNIVNYETILMKTGFDNNNNLEYNYLEYKREGNDSLSFEEYLNLIKPYLNDLINNKKDKGEWKLQLSAEISFVSQRPGSDETRVMYTRSTCE